MNLSKLKEKSNISMNVIPILGVIVASFLLIICSNLVFKSGFLPDKYNKEMEYYKGQVVNIMEEDIRKDDMLEEIEVGFQKVIVKINEGPYKGQTFGIDNPINRLYNIKLNEGTKVIVGCYDTNGEDTFTIFGYDRSVILYTLISLFAVVVILIGGIKGVKSLVSLVFTLVCCVFLMVPLMLNGVNPILAGVIMSSLSTIVTLFLVSGLNKKTLAAILGTVLGVLVASIIAYVFGKVSHLSGITMDDVESIMYIAEDTNLKIKGLMFAGILVASLGAVMDVAMSIASSTFEMYNIDKNLGFKSLFKKSMNIGKDIIGTMTNTLILAFVGGSISLLIYLYSAQMTYNKFINLDILGMELIQGLSGSIGIVLALPITAFIATYLCYKEK
ncbi:MAG: YibE/F family protein [Peptostreptococcaceae bacterium]